MSIRLGSIPLTEEQEEQERGYFRAVAILRRAGFPDARVILLVVLTPTDPVAAIALEKP